MLRTIQETDIVYVSIGKRVQLDEIKLLAHFLAPAKKILMGDFPIGSDYALALELAKIGAKFSVLSSDSHRMLQPNCRASDFVRLAVSFAPVSLELLADNISLIESLDSIAWQRFASALQSGKQLSEKPIDIMSMPSQLSLSRKDALGVTLSNKIVGCKGTSSGVVGKVLKYGLQLKKEIVPLLGCYEYKIEEVFNDKS